MNISRFRTILALLLSLGWAWSTQAQTASTDKAPSPESKKIQAAVDSLVSLEIEAVPDARSAANLGTERKGNGILIAPNWVLTIGYLILEADKVNVIDAQGKKLPGVAAGYDHSTGFGLVKLFAASKASPIEIGRARGVTKNTPVLLAGAEGAQVGRIIDRRQFTGAWEYLVEDAIFTSPPISNWGGTALIDQDGELIGVGSLFMRDVSPDERGIAGNMYVPIDLLRPILESLKETGRSGVAAKPWLGVSTEELYGALVVTRVSPDSPAAKAGLEKGDVLVAVGNKTLANRVEFYQTTWALGKAGVEVPLTVLRGQEKKAFTVKSMDRMDFLKPKTMF